MLKKSFSSIAITTAVLLITGCSQTSTIVKVDKPDGVQYKVFHPSFFDDASKVREGAISNANAFCNKTNKEMVVISERTTKPPYIVDNYPGIEILFACEGDDIEPVTENENIKPVYDNNDKYSKLAIIKKFLDDGTLTQQEFDEEKRKILAE